MVGLQNDAPAWQIASALDLVPTPRHISLTGNRHSLKGWQMVAGPGLASKGAEIMDERLRELGHSPLERSNSPSSSPGTILLVPQDHPLVQPFIAELATPRETAPPASLETSTAPFHGQLPKELGEQGYIIRFVRRGKGYVVLAMGADELGTLYAAQTLAHLVQPAPSDSASDVPELLEASVTDWPAFTRRCIGMIGGGGGIARWQGDPDPVAGYLDEVRPQIEWLARHKINYTVLGGGPPHSHRDEARRAVARLAAEYGIRLRQTFGTSINDAIEPAEWTDCVTRGTSKFCWSAHEAHRRRARRLAQEAASHGLGLFCLHVTDAGGLIDPEGWSNRCERCRQTYGDDYVQATADLFLTYYEALKEEAPDCAFEAVVYPYHYQWAVVDFPTAIGPDAAARRFPSEGFLQGLATPKAREEVRERLSNNFRALADRLPDEILITFREAGRDELEAATRLWGDHPLNAWVYLNRNHGWQGLWEPQARFIPSWYRGHSQDALYHAGLGYSGNLPHIRAAAAAEYAWNVDVPDASTEFTIASRFYEVGGRRPTAYQSHFLIPRILRRMWGDDWQAFRTLFEHNLSMAYVADPLKTTNHNNDGEATCDPHVFLAEQADLFALARDELTAYVAAMDAEPSRADAMQHTNPLGYQSALYLYEMVHLAAAKAEIEASIVEGMHLARSGLVEQAKERLYTLRARLPQIDDELNQVKARIASDPRLVRRRSERAAGTTDGTLYAFRPTDAASKIDDVLRQITAQVPQEAVGKAHAALATDSGDPHGPPLRITIDQAEQWTETVTYGYATQVRVMPTVHRGSHGDLDTYSDDVAVRVTVCYDDVVLAIQNQQVRLGPNGGRPLRPFEFDLGLEFTQGLIVKSTVIAPNGEALAETICSLDSPPSSG